MNNIIIIVTIYCSRNYKNLLNISLNRLIYIYLWRFVVIPNSKSKKVSKIIKNWINNNPEALLCQRFLDDKISFSPIWMKKLEINFLYFLTINNKNNLKSLEKSKIDYKTINIGNKIVNYYLLKLKFLK